MANDCNFTCKIVSKFLQPIMDFYHLCHNSREHFSRIYDLVASDIDYVDHQYEAYFSGTCAWSTEGCFLCATNHDNNIISLTDFCKREQIIVEIFSFEPMMGFSEHIIINNGDIDCLSVVDYEEYTEDMYDTYKKRHGIDAIPLNEFLQCCETDNYFIVCEHDFVYTI